MVAAPRQTAVLETPFAEEQRSATVCARERRRSSKSDCCSRKKQYVERGQCGATRNGGRVVVV